MAYLPIKEAFRTGFEQYAERNGQPFTIIGFIDAPDADHDAETVPMFKVRFEDGEEIEAWPAEIFTYANSGMEI